MNALYLDFDGPLHPNAAYINASGAHLRPPFEYHELFENAPILDELIGDAEDLQIIISSNWSMEMGLQECIDRLPKRIAERVTGTTWCPETLVRLGHQNPDLNSADLRSAWRRHSRYEQIAAHAESFGIPNWMAIDDQAERWPDTERNRLVHCDERDGLSRTLTQAECGRALRKLLAAAPSRRPSSTFMTA